MISLTGSSTRIFPDPRGRAWQVLEEMALTVQVHLVDSKLPFCAFNGGNGELLKAFFMKFTLLMFDVESARPIVSQTREWESSWFIFWFWD